MKTKETKQPKKGLTDKQLIAKYEGGKIDLKRTIKPALKPVK